MKYFRLFALAGALAFLLSAPHQCRADADSTAPAAVAPAATTPAPGPPIMPDKRAALVGLARQFVDKMNHDMETADNFLEKLEPEDIRVQKYFDAIPDGDPLLLDVHVGKVSLAQPVSGIKQGHDVMLSLADFVLSATFPIKVHMTDQTADGWFIRENQKFHLDVKAKTSTANGKVYPLAPGDVQVTDDDILVRGQALAKWFSFELIIDVTQQAMKVTPAQEFPAQEKADRDARALNANYHDSPPVLPRDPDPYTPGSIPNTDVTIDQGLARASPTSPITKTLRYSTSSAGDLAGFTNLTTTNGSDTEPLSSVRTTFSRSSENNDLLGPLDARFYEFGDIDSVNVPLAASDESGIGVHLTNKDQYTTFDTSTEITGNGTPGWDAELYRDSQYIEGVTIDPTGRYDFKNVDLFAGDNHFQVIQYGPQGEQKTEDKVISVTPNLYNVSGGAYDLSAVAQNTQTYLKTPATGPDVGAPNLSAIYDRQLTDNTSAEVGLNSGTQNGIRQEYAETGLISTIDKTILNGNVAVNNDGAYAAAVTARRSFGEHGVSLSAQYDGPNYGLANSSATAGSPVTPGVDSTTLRAAIRGPVPLPIGDRPSYEVDSQDVINGDGTAERTDSVNLNTRIQGISVGNILRDTVTTLPNDVIAKTSGGTFTLRGRAFGYSVRGTADYDIKPIEDINEYDVDIGKSFTPKLSGDLDVQYQPLQKYRSETLSLSWSGDHAIISPALSYDSNKAVSLLTNVRFGLARNPYNGDIAMSSQNASDKGGVSARVYLDRDGDDKFGPGDELLEDITVSAVQAHLEATTDKNGEAFIPNLQAGRVTDIVAQEGSNFDPSWVPGFAGVSVRPRPGHVTRIDFPIHMGGDMDGSLYVTLPQGKPRPVKDMHLALYDGDGHVVKNVVSGYDGYYSIEQIPPGHYLLILSGEDAKDQRLVRPPPEVVDVGFKGTSINNHNIFLNRVEVSTEVPITVQPDLDDYAKANPSLNPQAFKDKVIVLNLGEYNSRVLMAVVWYKLKMKYASLIGDAHLLVQPADSYALPKTGKITLRAVLPGYDVQGAWNRCHTLNAAGEYCAVEILPKGLQQISAADGVTPKT